MKKTLFHKWLENYGPTVRQETLAIGAINTIIRELQDLALQPRLRNRDWWTVQDAIARWRGARDAVVAARGAWWIGARSAKLTR